MGKTVFLVFAFYGLLCGQTIAQQLLPLANKGKDLAEEHCSRCHVVNQTKPFSGISSTPSFKLIVNELADWEERFSSFFTRLPHPAVVRFKDDKPNPKIEELHHPVIIEIDDIDALVAFARTLIK